MHHSIRIEQFGVRLRPIQIEDAAFIHRLRMNPMLSQFIGDTDPSVNKQKEWLEQYFLREGDYYFCVETIAGMPVGTIGLYDLINSRAEWGRWIISPPIPASPASVWLIYHIAFEILNLSEVYCRTVEDNKRVVSFHDSCGLERKGKELDGVYIKGELKNLIIHVATKENWHLIKNKMNASVLLAERLLNEVK
jgi:RimJ/RimL family protein N-acetyltransferase